eukprot:scaffold69889_cov63-Phaeocystis_antarctica.AAC.1
MGRGWANNTQPCLAPASTPLLPQDHAMCDMAHDGDGATEASFTSDADGLIYVVLQMAVWVMDEVRCVELQTAVQHQYGGASSIFILEFKFPGDDDWMVVGMKSLTADYADGTVNSSYTFAPGQRQLQEDSGSRRELEVVRKLEAATAEASDGASSNRRHLHALVCPTGYYDSTNGNARGFLKMWASVCWGNSGCPGSGSWSRSDSDCGCACVENPPVTLCTDGCMVGGRFWTQSASNDGQCDDGGAGSDFSDCALGTDCVDCGSREFTACSNDCGWANDGVCDDGGPDAAFSCCALGSDCNDCGDRAVPSADDNSGNYWSTICKVVETGTCASDAECTGSRLCTRSTNPSDDYVCSGDSGCEQVRLTSACPQSPPPTQKKTCAPKRCGCCVRQDWTSTTVVISLDPAASTAVCVDLDNGAVDPYNDACSDYIGNTHWCTNYDDDDFTSGTMCCACDGGEERAAPTQCLAQAGREAGRDNSWRCGAHVMQTCPEGRCCSRWGWCGSTASYCEVSRGTQVAYSNGANACTPPPPSAPPSPYGPPPSPPCTNTDNGATDPYSDACSSVTDALGVTNPGYDANTHWCANYDDDDFTSNTMCCACGGGTSVPRPSLPPPSPLPL